MRRRPHEARFFRGFGDVTYFLRQKTRSIGIPKHAAPFTGRCTQLNEHLSFDVFVICNPFRYFVYDAYARIQVFVFLTSTGIHTTQNVFHSSLGWKIIRMRQRRQKKHTQRGRYLIHNFTDSHDGLYLFAFLKFSSLLRSTGCVTLAIRMCTNARKLSAFYDQVFISYRFIIKPTF